MTKPAAEPGGNMLRAEKNKTPNTTVAANGGKASNLASADIIGFVLIAITPPKVELFVTVITNAPLCAQA
jgi:hypothetical protein